MKSPVNAYQQQQVKNATPDELIGIIYDMVIQSTYRKDEKRLHGLFDLLIKSLNFDYDVSESFYSLYEYCQHISKQQKFDEVRELMSGIRDAWYDGVIKNKKTSISATA